MKKIKKPLIVGNWKTNPATFTEARERFLGIRKASQNNKGIDVVVCPPFPYIATLSSLSGGGLVGIGAQDVSIYGTGSKTGEVSASMLETSGASYVIIGHSERRAMGETDSVVATKITQALKTDMTIILCVGENERDAEGEYLNVIKRQLKEALHPVNRSQFGQIVIAYEPVWAIGRTDNVAITSHDLHQMVIYIKKYLKENYSETTAGIVPILYGGSVTAENAQDILWNGEVQGLLVGRASFEADTFAALFSAASARQRSTIKAAPKVKRMVPEKFHRINKLAKLKKSIPQKKKSAPKKKAVVKKSKKSVERNKVKKGKK